MGSGGVLESSAQHHREAEPDSRLLVSWGVGRSPPRWDAQPSSQDPPPGGPIKHPSGGSVQTEGERRLACGVLLPRARGCRVGF